MKFFIYAVVIIVVIAILCGVGTVFSTNKIDLMLDSLEEVSHSEKEVPKNAAEAVEKVSNEWEKNMFLISMLLPHQRLDEVKEKLVKLKAYAASDEFPEWRDALMVFKDELLHIRGLLGVNLDNIL